MVGTLLGPPGVAGRVLQNRVCPSFCLSFYLSRHLLGIVSLVFCNFGMVLETHLKLCVTDPDFLEKLFLPKKLGKWTRNGPKARFFEFIAKFGHQFLLNLFNNRNIFLFLSCLVLEIGAKIFSANQNVEFFYQPYFQNKSLKYLNFLHVDANPHKLKVD